MAVHVAEPCIIMCQTEKSFSFKSFSQIFKVSKEGEGLKKVWQQHFQQFRNVSAEMAAAIVAVYPSPQSLLQVRFLLRSKSKIPSLILVYFILFSLREVSFYLPIADDLF